MLRTRAIDAEVVGAFAADLRQAGVDVVDDVDAPSSMPVRVTKWQAENMLAKAANGGGVAGRTLAALAPTPAGVPPVPFLIDAWIRTGSTPAAVLARALRDAGDPEPRPEDAFQQTFPDAVLALFVADATATTPASDGPAASVTAQAHGAAIPLGPVVLAAAHRSIIDAPCSAASSFVHDAIQAVADALTIRTRGGGFFSFLAAIWNTAVRLAATFVSGLIETLTRPIVAQLVAVLNGVAAVQQIASILIAWRAPLQPQPAENRYGVTPESVTGTVSMTVQPHSLPVPAAVKDCAASVGVDVSASAAGSTVTWTKTATGRPDLAVVTVTDRALDASESASLRYTTGQESPQSQAEPLRTGVLTVTATIRRNDVERARAFIHQLLLNQVPTALRSLVDSLAGPILDAATERLAELVDVRSTTRIPIAFHDEPRCQPGAVAPGTYTGTFDKKLRGGAGVTGRIVGTVTITVDTAGGVSGEVADTVDTQAPSLGRTFHGTERVTLSGSLKSPVVTVVERTLDGKALPTGTRAVGTPMVGLCPAAIRWSLASLAPGVAAVGTDGWDLVVPRTRPS